MASGPGLISVIVVRAAAAARLEGRGRGEKRQVLVRRGLEEIGHVPGLSLRDDLHGGVVGHEREVGMDRHGGLADRLAHIFQSGVVIGLRSRHDGGLGPGLRHDLALRVTLVDRARFGAEIRHLPGIAVLGEFEIDEAEMAAPEARHHGRLAVQRALLHVDPRDVREFLAAREDEVLVAGQDHVDAVDLGQMQSRVLLAALALAAGDARMAERDDDVSARLPQIRHVLDRRVDDVDRRGLAVEMRLVPLHDLRRHEADDADLHLLPGAALVGELAVEDQPRLVEGLALRRHDVRADDREFRRPERIGQELEAVVELVIAHRAAIVVEHVHGGDHRVHVAGLHAFAIGDEVAQGRALDQVAVVEEKRIPGLRAGGLHERRGASEADRVVGGVAVIIVREDVHVEIRGLQDPQLHDAERPDRRRGSAHLRRRRRRRPSAGLGGG